jgi:aldehyde dehydrogenase (NAD+)
LHKSYEETYLTEISIVKQEIDNHIKHLKKWSTPRKVPKPLYLQPSSSRIINEPLGVALIMAPWNYHFQLLFTPLVGAISADCCAILKPSELTPHIAEVMAAIIKVTFNEQYIALVQGDHTVGESTCGSLYRTDLFLSVSVIF